MERGRAVPGIAAASGLIGRVSGLWRGLAVGVGRRQTELSDIFRVDACVAMQTIAHFFDEALSLGGAGVIRFGHIREEADDTQ